MDEVSASSHEGVPATPAGQRGVLSRPPILGLAPAAPRVGLEVWAGVHPGYVGHEAGGGAAIASFQLLDALPVVKVVRWGVGGNEKQSIVICLLFQTRLVH